MSNKLTISAISTLTAMPTSKPSFGVTPNPNMMPTSQEKAPVLLRIESTGTVEAEEFAERFAAKCAHIDTAEAVRRINALGEVIAEFAADCKGIQLGFMNLETNVSGTIPDTNAPLNEANEVFYTAVLSDAWRRMFGKIETHIPTSVTPADVKRIRDVATGDNKIHGTDPFFIQGLKLTTGGTGEKIELMNEDNTEKIADVEVIDGTSDISVKAQLSSRVEAGRYYLVVTTLAGGDTTLYPVGTSVTVVKSTVEPKILSVLSEGTGLDSDLTTLKDKVTVSVEGCRLRNAKAQFILRDHDGRYMASTDFDDRYHYADFEILSDTQATYHCRENGSEEPDGSWAAYDAALQIKLEDGTLLEKPVNIRS